MSHTSQRPGPGDALIMVDVQNDFLPGGSLAVPDGDAVVPVLNRFIFLFQENRPPIIATRDWHPKNHCSFREQGGPWPPHCVQYSTGASFSHDLDLPCEAHIISKGADPEKEAYSGFDGTNLHSLLLSLMVKRLFIGGLATDYCVQATVLDGCRLGYEVLLLIDACRAVNARAGDGDRAVAVMREQGAIPVTLEHLAP